MNIIVLVGACLGCAVTLFILGWLHHLETNARLKDWKEIKDKYGN